ncbi:MAG: four-carbon acid sugar kinase family protein [Pirellulales bacterium]
MLLGYYGDDFTGSTDVLEALTTSGVPTALFTEPPSPDLLSRFPHVKAIGIAGNSRTMSPAQMDAVLPAAFKTLRDLNPAIVHYKTCSTFDSSPVFGSIGRAIEIGQRVFQNRVTPLVVGSPNLQRFCVFGNLFARSGLDSPVHRLDRHPTMSYHPVTPMMEADLRLHLREQTPQPVSLVDVLTLDRGKAAVNAVVDESAGRIVLYDTLTSGHLSTIGESIWQIQQAEGKPYFVAGSSGIESALTAHWREVGIAESESKGFAPPRSVAHALMISGSCSPVTERQIAWATAHGVMEVPLDAAQLLNSPAPESEISAVARRIAALLDAGRSVVAHTCRGPGDERIRAAKQAGPSALCGDALGVILGRILARVLDLRLVERVAVAGGDTSGAVARAVGISALEMIGPLAPGAPLCVAHSRSGAVAGVEFTFKGGQVGHDDFFAALLAGGPNR